MIYENTTDMYVYYEHWLWQIANVLGIDNININTLCACSQRIQIGSKSTFVTLIARRLNDLGFLCEISNIRTDSIKNAIIQLQKTIGTEQTGTICENSKELYYLFEWHEGDKNVNRTIY